MAAYAYTATPYISIVKLDQQEYNIKDAEARSNLNDLEARVSNLGAPMHFKGNSQQGLTDGGTQNPTKASGNLTADEIAAGSPVASGDVYLSSSAEYVWTGSAWELLGDEGSYAVKGTYAVSNWGYTNTSIQSTGTYTPAGNITSLTFATTAIEVSGSYDKATGVATSDTTVTSTVSYQPAGSISKPTFTGTTATISAESSEQFVKDVTGGEGAFQIPDGLISRPTFTGTAANLSVSTSYTPEGTVSGNFSGTAAQIDVATSYAPAGSVSLTGKTTGTVVTSVVSTLSTPDYVASVNDETLVIGTALLSGSVTHNTGTAVTALTGATFAGTTATITSTGSYTPQGSLTNLGFAGTTATITSTGSYTPQGTISTPTFSWATTSTKTITVAVDITPTKEYVTVGGSYVPEGSVSQPSFTGTTATITVTGTYVKATGVNTSATAIQSSGSYDKFSGASFSGTAATITVTGSYQKATSASVTLS